MSTWQPRVDELVGRFVAATNTTVLGRSGAELVIYKPVAGNRPLWDFDAETLATREVLTHRVAAALGLDVVPETVMGDGPLGPGAVQRYIELDAGFDPTPMVRAGSAELWPIAVLDVIVNNADRKLGHILRDGGGRLWAIDHGLTFHPEDKLRTVLWCFAGQTLPHPMREAVDRLAHTLDHGLKEEVQALLGSAEAAALAGRVAALLDAPVHPEPPDDRPPIPWPLF